MDTVRIIGENLPNMPWQEKPEGAVGPVWRHSDNPVIHRNPVKGVARIFNSAVVPFEGEYVGIFRAESTNGRSHLHMGRSKDGLKWTIEEKQIPFVNEQGKPFQPNYAYDPRLVKVEDVYYIIWCTDFYGAAIGVARTTDFESFVRLENPFLPFNRNGVLFPRKINGNFVMLSRPSDSGHTPFGDVFLSESPDFVYWGKHRHVMSKGGQGWWQSVKIGGGPAPIETSEGWLMFYHGVTGTCNGLVYSMGAVILDKDEPSKVKYRSSTYVLTPEEWYEERGFVPNVVFPCATLTDAETGRIAIYYGAADTYVGVAYTTAQEIIDYVKATHEEVGDDAEIGIM
ncbi:Beta-1,4-mannooligosaccharide phosphorylase [Paenibacillus plantiphilus]|uniref:Beta-1,4-mannooligosaccharide phosphorylase n=1 Tax=Paenibacillus plantiphilus TaxID=2905650 RepID=A0ABN8GCI4_9BACL|nr:glycoside hydrolase family 130 protein [Paenibacillus plantiphilus]CAH1202694.1 Beta-1,4-mannooligosaccharide phosphorylase [Paenibacillus plantiphilus]